MTSLLARLAGSPYTLLTLVPVFWSGNFILSQVVLRELPPVTTNTLRFTLATAILWAVLWRRHGPVPWQWPLRWRHVPLFVFLGLTGVAIFNSVAYAALRLTTPTNAALINAGGPMATVALSALLIRERMSPRQIAGLVLSFAGVVWVVSRGSLSAVFGLSFNTGDLLMLGDIVIWALYSVAGKRAMEEFPPLVATAYAMVVGLVFLWPATALELLNAPAISMSVPTALSLAYMAVFATVLAFSWWYVGIARIGAGKTAIFMNVMPLSTAILAFLIWGERIGVYHLVGGLAILTGVYLTSLRPGR